MGYPTSIANHTLTWNKSGTLNQWDQTTYEYNIENQLIQKVKNGITTNYYAINHKIHQINIGTNILKFFYALDKLVYFTYNGTRYFYVFNAQNDITHLVDDTGNIVASYIYDAWGNHQVLDASGIENTSADFIGNINPYRYRGYLYDTETGYFWLSSRYYSPELCRFISPDSVDYLDPSSINGLNLYAYCENDPINRYDPSGHFWDYVFDAAFIAWGIYDLVNGGYKDWKNWVALGVDIVFAVLPFVPSGAGQVIKVGNKIDNAVDVASAINRIDNIQDMSKVTMIGRSIDRVTDTATLIGKADNLYDAWKGYDATATGLKRVAHNGISMLHDAGWRLWQTKKWLHCY